jgi:N-methylhydantoinase A
MVGEGYAVGDIEINRFADMRYVGQAYELTVGVPEGRPELDVMARAFAEEHRRTYGHAADDPVQLVNVRIVARSRSNGHAAHRPATAGAGVNGDGASRSRDVVFEGHGVRTTPVTERQALAAGIDGPLIVEEYDSTCVVPPGWHAELDDMRNIHLTRLPR